ncbi:MAG: short-chain dehydrogenase/reductase [Nonomuraea muscovyensis]|nr:short-chain dehydrogenase/reductase [Nonomuraea muscovyensis]
MARTIVITGGTNGIGKALAHHYTEPGDQVVAVGSSEEGGRRLRDTAPRARFIRSDLSSLGSSTPSPFTCSIAGSWPKDYAARWRTHRHR